MYNAEKKKCPYCAEMIKQEAVRCRYCGSALVNNGAGGFPASLHWRRVKRGKKIAGVCTGLAGQFDSTALILPLRVFFLVTTVFFGFGPLIYIMLWILMPAPDNGLEAAAESRPSGTSTPEGGSP